jgi:hypothetical protein
MHVSSLPACDETEPSISCSSVDTHGELEQENSPFLTHNINTTTTTGTNTQSSTVPGIPDTPASFVNGILKLLSDFKRSSFIDVSVSACVATASCLASSRYSAADSSGDAGPCWPMCRRAMPPSRRSAITAKGMSHHDGPPRILSTHSLYVTRTQHWPITVTLPVPLSSKHFGAYYSSRKNAFGAAFSSPVWSVWARSQLIVVACWFQL